MKNDILGLSGLILVLAALGLYFLFAPKAAPFVYAPIDVSSGFITVQDQDDVNAVTLDAELGEAGWITVHESLSNAPAAIVGTSAYMPAGTYKDFTIELDEPMLPGFFYITLLHKDNGDQVYVTNDDLPARVNGEVVRSGFTAVPEAVTIPEPDSIPPEE